MAEKGKTQVDAIISTERERVTAVSAISTSGRDGYVMVNFQSKCRNYHYIGWVESIEVVTARLLRENQVITSNDMPTFALKKNSEASFPLSDFLKKLSAPQNACGTARKEQQCIIHNSLQP